MDTDALERNPRIIIRKPIILLTLLRNFGHFIRNLGVDFWRWNAKIRDAIESYLAIYCSDSLERCDLCCLGPEMPFENLRKPLKKLKALRLRTYLDQQQNFVQFINESNLPNLQYLYISTFINDINPHEKIHHKNVEYLTVECRRMNAFPFSFENLKELSFFANIEVNDTFCEYIGSMKHLKTMKLKSSELWGSDSLDKLLQDVPLNVEKIRFGLSDSNCRNMSTETMSNFMKQNRTLQTICFAVWTGVRNRASEVWLQQLTLKLSEEWECDMVDPDNMYKFYVMDRKTT